MTEKLTCRVQYLNDADPFATTSTCYLEPMRPVSFAFSLHLPIGDQIPEVIRLLKAHHKSGDSALQVYRMLDGGVGDFGSYLDADMNLLDQPDELQMLQSDARFMAYRSVYSSYSARLNDLLDAGGAPPTAPGPSSFTYTASTLPKCPPEDGAVLSPFVLPPKKLDDLPALPKKLPFAVKPLQQVPKEPPKEPTPSLLRRSNTTVAAKPWYSSSVDTCLPSTSSASSTLPRNFHSFDAPFVVEYIDADVPPASKPPAKPKRTLNYLTRPSADLPTIIPPVILDAQSSPMPLKSPPPTSTPRSLPAFRPPAFGNASSPASSYMPSSLAHPPPPSILDYAPRQKPLDDLKKPANQEGSPGRRTSLVLRTQPALRVKAIIDKLQKSNGRDQRRALFTLKDIFQDDKDLVPEFVQSEGLDCLVRLGRSSDQNHQNFILRALGQILLYVDGMNGIIAHNETIQWLYELLDSPLFDPEQRAEMSQYRLDWYRLVVKTALKLLLVFVEYTESNALLLMAAVCAVDRAKGRSDWANLMRVLHEKDNADVEPLIYGMTVVNKTLNGVPDQDTYYDIVDALDGQGLEDAMARMLRLGNKELAEQCRLYEKVLSQEDAAGDSDSGDSTTVRMRGGGLHGKTDSLDRRSMMRRRQQEALERQEESIRVNSSIKKFEAAAPAEPPMPKHPPWRKQVAEEPVVETPSPKKTQPVFVEPETLKPTAAAPSKKPEPIRLVEERADATSNQENEAPEREVKAPPPSFPSLFSPTETKTMEFPVLEAKKESPPPAEPKETRKPGPIRAKVVDDSGGGGFAAMLQRRAKKHVEGGASFEPKISEAEQQWQKAAETVKSKPLIINDLDFSAFHKDELEQDPLVLARMAEIAQTRGVLPGGAPPPPPMGGAPPPPPMGATPPPPPLLRAAANGARGPSPAPSMTASKTGTLKLHWKPAQAEAPPVPALKKKGTFWHKMDVPQIDTSKLAQLFEQKQKEVVVKKGTAEAKPQLLQVLDNKRSQLINIALTKLPPVNTIPPAIMKFDSTVLNKDGIEKILQSMMPHEEETAKIQLAVAEHPEKTLGNAEQFLLSLSAIPNLGERLRLWMFTLDYHSVEKDISEPLMDLSVAMKEIEESATFRTACAMLLSIGNTLNGSDVKGFQLDYLSRASEIKDPVYKHTLIYHLAEFMIDHFPDGSDLYSEFGAVARSAKIDYAELLQNLKRLETDCKRSWEYLGKICRNDSASSMRQKIDTYLTECAQRIHQLKVIQRVTTNKWHAFLIFFGYTVKEVPDQKPNEVMKLVNEFALEYRTTRDKILQQRKRVADKRERNKTRGKIWALEGQNGAPSAEPRRRAPLQSSEMERHEEMSRLLTGSAGDDTLGRRRALRPTPERATASKLVSERENVRDADEDNEILDGLVKAATIQAEPRDHRRKARQFNRKSLRRTRTLKLVDDQMTNMNLSNY